MLQSEYRDACQQAVIEYWGEFGALTDVYSKGVELYPFYETACALYAMPRFDEICKGLRRHVNIAAWMLQHQQLVLRYHRLRTVGDRILEEYRQAAEQQHAATQKLARMRREYPGIHMAYRSL